MMGGLPTRDTDADWRHIGETEPFWGVATFPQFKSDVIGDAELEAFYASGRTYVSAVRQDFHRFFGLDLQVRRALDFGCGVGRLCEAMTAYAEEVTGYDVSPGMLKTARSRGAPVRYVESLPDEQFDWINAFIVFQHIPPEPGLQAFEALLQRLAPNGMLSLHFTIWREPGLQPPSRSLGSRLRGFEPPVGTVQMYDYDFNELLRRLNRVGVQRLALSSTDHGGHHGVLILAGRTHPPEPPRY